MGDIKLLSCTRHKAVSAKLIVLTSPTPALSQCFSKLPAGQRKQAGKAEPPGLMSQRDTSLNQGYQQTTIEGFCAEEYKTGSALLERLTCQNRQGFWWRELPYKRNLLT